MVEFFKKFKPHMQNCGQEEFSLALTIFKLLKLKKIYINFKGHILESVFQVVSIMRIKKQTLNLHLGFDFFY